MVILKLPVELYQSVWRHLLPRRCTTEEAAFVFAVPGTEGGGTVFRPLDWFPVPASGFASRSPFHLELSDETRAAVIKRAHDLGASLVEFHSHTGVWPAEFSASDLAGFSEFVPHVRWRLKGRPYLAVVVARGGYDGFVWATASKRPDRLAGISSDGQFLLPTGLSPTELGEYDATE